MTLDEARAAVGLAVVYDSGHGREQGIVTSVNDRWVFVRYGSDSTSKATAPKSLQRLAR